MPDKIPNYKLEIEITPKMIEAVSDEIWDAGFGGAGEFVSVQQLSKNALEAALRAGGFAVKTLPDREPG